MTKKELLDDLSKKEFCNKIIGEPILAETKSNGDKWYRVNFREVVGNVCVYRNIDFYVINEGLDGEVAYYKDSEPKQQIVVPVAPV